MNEATAIDIFKTKFPKTDYDQAYWSFTTHQTKSGRLVILWYERNTWADPQIEKKILLRNDGFMFENFQKIGTWQKPKNYRK